MQVKCMFILQNDLWSGEDDTAPPLPAVVTMVMTLHQLCTSISMVTLAVVEGCGHTADMEGLCVSAGSKCQQLAVAVLSMLRTTVQGKALSTHVQTLSQHMAKAAKHLNHIAKTQVNTAHH